jgi:hypothetical protein
VGRETEGKQVKHGIRSLGKIQTSIVFVRRESPCTLGRSEDFRDCKKSIIQEVKGSGLHGMSTKYS